MPRDHPYHCRRCLANKPFQRKHDPLLAVFFHWIANLLSWPSAAHVFAFEADPEIAVHLRDNIAYNRFANTAVDQKLSSRSLRRSHLLAPISPTYANRGLGCVTRDGDGTTNSIRFSAVSLDQYCGSHSAPDFIKCVVEGAACEVFRGAAELLHRRHPILVREMHSGENYRRLCPEFAEFGYDCSALDENHYWPYPAEFRFQQLSAIFPGAPSVLM